MEVEGEKLKKRDSIEITDVNKIKIKTKNSYFMVIEVPI